MKKAMAIIVSVLFVLSVAGFAFAAEQEGPKGEPGAVGQMKEMLSAKGLHQVTGEVTAVDAAAKTLTIKGKKGEVMLTTTDKTNFPKGKTLADVKVGDKLTASYVEKGGKKMAMALKVVTKEEMKEIKKETKEKEKK